METYNAMREFADSWALLGMFLFFLGVVVSVLLPGAKAKADDAAQIPLLDGGDPPPPVDLRKESHHG